MSSSMVTILCILAIGVSVSQGHGVEKRSVAVEMRPHNFRPNCSPLSIGHGCRCTLTNEHGIEESMEFGSDADCRKPIELQTAENKQKVQQELLQKFGGFRDNCSPKPSGGCRCTTTNSHGVEETMTFEEASQCRKPVAIQTAENKAAVQGELKANFAGLKENCFPKPSGGCRCVEKDSEGAEVEKRYESESECKVAAGGRLRRRRDFHQQRPQSPINQQNMTHSGVKDHQRAQSPASQNVRDPVREKAQANYALVLEELKEKFKGLKEGCYPRPKGCLCVIGKDVDGRDITDRRMSDSDCKCREGERSRECPAPGA